MGRQPTRVFSASFQPSPWSMLYICAASLVPQVFHSLTCACPLQKTGALLLPPKMKSGLGFKDLCLLRVGTREDVQGDPGREASQTSEPTCTELVLQTRHLPNVHNISPIYISPSPRDIHWPSPRSFSTIPLPCCISSILSSMNFSLTHTISTNAQQVHYPWTHDITLF